MVRDAEPAHNTEVQLAMDARIFPIYPQSTDLFAKVL